MNFDSKKKLTLFIFSLCLCISIFSQQKKDCKINIKDIEKDYQIGKFKSVEKSLRDCLENGNLDYITKKDGYRLLAMNSIAMDLMNIATQDLKELLNIDSNYSVRSDDPIVLVRLIEKLRAGRGRTVTSVSKIAESLNEAPANIVIVTREEIKERGYMDLEQVFHDLPGFDISKTNGATYSSIYQSGYRTNNNNDRSLFLIDGIEDNDLWSNSIWLSRQYPMSNIKQVDVIYGPASTMYGANAFVGVYNLTTLLPEDIIPSMQENFGLTGNFGRGSYNTKTADITVAFRKNKLSGTLTSRFFSSDEPDRSEFDDFDYKYTPASIAAYEDLRMNIDPTVAENDFVNINTTENYAYYTPLGALRAQQLDSLGFANDNSNKDIAYSNKTLDRYVLAKLMYNNFTLGFQYWNREEGLAWFNDKVFAGTDNGSKWNPTQKSYYLKYDKNISDSWNITNLALYKDHKLGKSTGLAILPASYLSRGKNTTVNGSPVFGSGYRDVVSETVPQWRLLKPALSSRQLRDELKITYLSSNFNLISGMEARYTEVQEDYAYTENSLASIPIHYIMDVGLYSQGNYSRKDIKLVFGGRLDYNRIDENGGYGVVFNPRLALVYSPKNWVFKGIYSEAFKDATNFDKYSVLPGTRDVPNPTLQPEKVKNSEVSVSWDNTLTKKKGMTIFLGASAHYTNYSGAVETARNVDGNLQNLDIGALKVLGGQFNSFLGFNENIKLNLNYTYTAPYKIGENNMDVRIGDIATHKGNLILNWKFSKIQNSNRYRFNWNNRLNMSGERPTGENTSVATNPISSVAPFVILNSYFSYSNKFGLTFGLGINNALDADWMVPGAREAAGRYASTVPQPGRNYFLNLRYDLY